MDQVNLESKNIQTIKIDKNEEKIKSFTTRLNKKILFILSISLVVIASGLIFVYFTNNKKTDKNRVVNTNLFTLDEINFSDYPPALKDEILYSKAEEDSNYYLLNIKTKLKKLLYSNKNADPTARYFFSPAKNYIIYFKSEGIDNNQDNKHYKYTLRIYDNQLKTYKTIYEGYFRNKEDFRLQSLDVNYISPSSNKIIVVLNKAVFQGESTYVGNDSYIYSMDLKNKSEKLISKFHGLGRVLGWSKDENKIYYSSSVDELLEINILNNAIKKIPIVGDMTQNLGLIDRTNSRYIYMSNENSKNGEKNSLVIQDLNDNSRKLIEEANVYKNWYKSYQPISISEDGKKLIYEIIEFTPSNNSYSYVIYDSNTQQKKVYSRAEDAISEFNEYDDGVRWFARCVNRESSITIDGEKVDSTMGYPNNPCGQMGLVEPYQFIENNVFKAKELNYTEY